jgi:carboxyl-terminal processing protease
MLNIHSTKTVSMRSTLVVGFVCVATGLGVGLFVSVRAAEQGLVIIPATSSAPADVDMNAVWKAWAILNEHFVPDAVATSSPLATTTAKINQQKVWGMISGMAASLNDPYTFFLPPQENKDFGSSLSGNFEGIGMEIDVKHEVLTVVSPLKGTPAEKAGLKPGDLVLKIDGVVTNGMSTSVAVSKIRGPKGTQVTLSVLRAGWSAPRDIKVTRDVINVPIVTETARKDGVYVIAVSQFTANSPDLFRDALKNFVNSKDTKLVLDFRGNPGGYLDAAVSMASWFLPEGKIVVTEDYDGHAQNIVHRSAGYNVFNKNLKAVILVDKGSASASEILADALRYYGVVKMVGTNTFGKGVVQELFPITPETSIKVTVARWLGPDGLQIPHEGLVPDVVATSSDISATTTTKTGTKPDAQMDKAVEVLNKM